MGAPPRLSIGLPVYDGAEFLGESIESLLGQTYEDFELIISDNASTDETPEICRRYARLDSRIRYYRHADNIGSAANHNFVLGESRGELWKWASHDDVYARQLLERCVEALDACPEVLLAHCLTAMIDSSRKVTLALAYPLATSSPRAPERFRSVLFRSGGDDFYGVMRKHSDGPVLHLASCRRSDRVWAATLSLHGPFAQIPDWLYFRREHPERPCDSEQPLHGWYEVERDWPLGRAHSAMLDPRRANPLRYPTPRLYAEYVWAFVTAIRRAPLSPADRAECYRSLVQWLANRAHLVRSPASETPLRRAETISVDGAGAGRHQGAT